MKYVDDVRRCIAASEGQGMKWLASPLNILDRKLYSLGRWDSL